MSYKILVATDCHLSARAPASRIDDFAETGLGKLQQIATICKSREVDVVVFAGDFFNTREQPWHYYNQVVSILKDIKEAVRSKTLYSIVGNTHDIPYDKLEFLSKTPVGAIFESGIFTMLKDPVHLCNGRITLVGQSIGELPPGEFKPSQYPNSVFVYHGFYGQQWDDNYFIDPKNIVSLGYKVIALGHDHVPYEPVRNGDTLIVRPGSLMRGTSHKYNVGRAVNVAILEYDGVSTMSWSVEYVRLDIQEGKLIFSQRALDKKSPSQFSMANAMDFIEQFVTKKSAEKNHVFRILDSLEISIEVRQYLEDKLQTAGLYRT